LAYCAEQGLAIVEDASNQSRAYMRNRVRLDLLPTLEGYNPKVREVLARTADLLAEDAGALDAIVGALHADIAQPGEGSLRYALDRWRTQPVGIQRRLLRCGLEALLGTVTDVRAQPIEDALGLVRSGSAGRTYHLPYGVELCVGHDAFELRLHGRALPRNSRNTWGREGPRV
jgi:tRNA(Ile)-lysidine synthase